jgi:triosephosphate isomerase (TIM)
MIFINFKSNVKSTGDNAVKLAQEFKKVQKETKVPIILSPHDFDLSRVREVWDGEIYVQHADYDRGTGRNQIELVKEWDGKLNGVFLNHSERKYDGYGLLSRVVNECVEYDLKSLVFAGSTDEIDKILEAQTHPTYIAYEPPELVGSNDTSVAKAKPEIIKKAHAVLEKSGIPLIVGAGVKDKADVVKSLELGAVGIAVSSAIILADDPGKKVLELASGFKA